MMLKQPELYDADVSTKEHEATFAQGFATRSKSCN